MLLRIYGHFLQLFTYRLIPCPNQFFKRIKQNSWNARMVSSSAENATNFLIFLSHYSATMIEIHLSKHTLVSSCSTKRRLGDSLGFLHNVKLIFTLEPTVHNGSLSGKNTRMKREWLVLVFLIVHTDSFAGGLAIFVVCRSLILNRAQNDEIVYLWTSHNSILKLSL